MVSFAALLFVIVISYTWRTSIAMCALTCLMIALGWSIGYLGSPQIDVAVRDRNHVIALDRFACSEILYFPLVVGYVAAVVRVVFTPSRD